MPSQAECSEMQALVFIGMMCATGSPLENVKIWGCDLFGRQHRAQLFACCASLGNLLNCSELVSHLLHGRNNVFLKN